LKKTVFLDGLVEELPLGEAHPPLVRLLVTMSVEELEETHVSLLTNLSEVGAHLLLITAVGSLGAETTKSESAVAGDSKVLDGIRIEDLLCLTLGLLCALHKASIDEESDVHEQTIGVATHIEGAEHDVGLEVVKSLVDDIVLVRGGLRSRALELGRVTNRKKRNIADVPPVGVLHGLAALRCLVKAGVICSRRHCE